MSNGLDFLIRRQGSQSRLEVLSKIGNLDLPEAGYDERLRISKGFGKARVNVLELNLALDTALGPSLPTKQSSKN